MTHSLRAVAPDVWRVVARQVAELSSADTMSLTALYTACQRPPNPQRIAELATLEQLAPEHQKQYRNDLLTELSANDSWFLDGAIHRGLHDIFQAIPELKPLTCIGDLSGYDIDLPDGCEPQSHGIIALWSNEALAPCIDCAQRFGDTDAATRLAESSSRNWWQRQRIQRAVMHWLDPFLWQRWQAMVAALIFIDENAHHLALVGDG